MSSQITHSPKVFISYSWDSPEHMDSVLALADRLVADGMTALSISMKSHPLKGGRTGWKDKFEMPSLSSDLHRNL
jgi:hypothetical protein